MSHWDYNNIIAKNENETDKHFYERVVLNVRLTVISHAFSIREYLMKRNVKIAHDYLLLCKKCTNQAVVSCNNESITKAMGEVMTALDLLFDDLTSFYDTIERIDDSLKQWKQ